MDLNVLVTLDALLSEGNVTRAAQKVGLSQPATSHALGRLRVMFEDPLLVRSGRGMMLTPRAEALRGPLKRWLAEAERLLQHDVSFEPRQTKRTFVLCCPDLIAPLLPAILKEFGCQAPKARLEVLGSIRQEKEALLHGEVDMVIGLPMREESGLMQRMIRRVDWGVVGRCGHPLWSSKGGLTLDGWLSYPHIMVRRGHQGESIVERELERLQLQRQVGLVAPGFLAALLALQQTDALFMTVKELVLPLAKQWGLIIRDAPLSLPSVPIVATWHERYHTEPAHRFFRTLIVSVMKEQLTSGLDEFCVGALP